MSASVVLFIIRIGIAPSQVVIGEDVSLLNDR